MNKREQILTAVMATALVAAAVWAGVLFWNRPKSRVVALSARERLAANAKEDGKPEPAAASRKLGEQHNAGEEKTFGGISFIWCPAGEYEQGSKRPVHEIVQICGGRPEWYADEMPATAVKVESGFWLSKTEVTRGQWAQVTGADAGAGDPQEPMTGISWQDCQTFLKALNARNEGQFSLPSETEWEWACRAGAMELFYFGDDPAQLDAHVWMRANAPDGMPRPVGGKQANQWGFYDMLGNVWEWCDSAYAAYGANAAPVPGHRVIRGGGVNSTAPFLRCAYRTALREDQMSPRVGLRLKREAD